MSPSSCWSTPLVSGPSLLRGGGVEPNVDTFEPFTILEIMSGLRHGVVGRFPDIPPSEAIGSGTWDWEEDALFTIDYGDGEMRIFHATNLSFHSSEASVASLLDSANLIMDGDTIVGLNIEAWYESISTDSLYVRYESVPMVSYDEAPRPDPSFTNTKAVWFQAPSGIWVAGKKMRMTMHFDLDYGQDVDVIFTRLVPNYYLQTERDAEVVARMVLGDFEYCAEGQGNQKFLTGCTPFTGSPQDEVPSSLNNDPPRDLSDFGTDSGSNVDCGNVLSFKRISADRALDAALGSCNLVWGMGGWGLAAGVAAVCCGGAFAGCGGPPQGIVCCAIGAFVCGVGGRVFADFEHEICDQIAWDIAMSSYAGHFADYLSYCVDNNETCTVIPIDW